MAGIFKALMLGDVVGQPGCRALFVGLNSLLKETQADAVIVNGENADEGFGLTPSIADRLLALGVDVITTGNHIWQKEDIISFMERNGRVLRPANYPKSTPGSGFFLLEKKGVKIGVMNLIGRKNLLSVDCPFNIGKKIINEHKKNCDFFLVDFHAEEVEEKECLAYFFDGLASVVFGTHTHIQTADERILPKGTGYISDIGMCGPVDSVIGSDPTLSIQREMTQMPIKLQVLDNDSQLSGILCDIEIKTGRCLAIQRIQKRL